MATKFKTLREYLYPENKDKKTFVVPNYQRGYKWAVKEKGKNLSAVEKLMDDLIKAYKAKVPTYFIQGITVSEEDNKIILIDGQQRTTTLYLMLYCIDKSNIQTINLQYDIRQESKDYINKLKNNSQEQNEKNQDVYYFQKAIEQIQKYLKEVDNKEELLQYVLDKVQILYIIIDKEKATKTFTMMNGSKATMLQEELIKAEMLRLISLPDTEQENVSTSIDDNLAELKEIIAKDWETNALRSRYAREWDKWLYWWNITEVQNFFNIKTPMGLLLEYYCRRNNFPKYSFDNFRKLIRNKKSTKEHFKGLRDLQKSFEDIFNIPKIHNYLGLSLIDAGEHKFEIINYFIDNKKDNSKLADYAKWRIVGATHLEITDPNRSNSQKTKEERATDVLKNLSGNFVYGQSDNDAFKQLIRLNVNEDNKLNRQFDFKIWQDKSLEHIYPKSKVFHLEDGTNYYSGGGECLGKSMPVVDDDEEMLNRDKFENDGSEHCIGNLVLLYKNENSGFGNKKFADKKKRYFNTDSEFKSRHLLHSVSVFAEEKWGVPEIQKNKEKFINRLKQDYNL